MSSVAERTEILFVFSFLSAEIYQRKEGLAIVLGSPSLHSRQLLLRALGEHFISREESPSGTLIYVTDFSSMEEFERVFEKFNAPMFKGF